MSLGQAHFLFLVKNYVKISNDKHRYNDRAQVILVLSKVKSVLTSSLEVQQNTSERYALGNGREFFFSVMIRMVILVEHKSAFH